jgi:hypothetical protein
MRLSPVRYGASSARLYPGLHCEHVHPSEEPHLPDLRNLNKINLGQYDTESAVSVVCAHVCVLIFARSCAFKRLLSSKK